MSLIVAGEFKECTLEEQGEQLVNIMKCAIEEDGMSPEMIDNIRGHIAEVSEACDGYFGFESVISEAHETMVEEINGMLEELKLSGTKSIFTKELEDARDDLNELISEA